MAVIFVHSGNNAVKITPGVGDAWYTPQIVSSHFTVVPDQSYQLSFWTRGDGISAGAYGIYDATHLSYIGPSKISTAISSTTYAQVTTTFIAPAGCNSIGLYLYQNGVATGHSIYFDDVSVKQMVTKTTLYPISLQTLLNNFPSTAVTFSDPNGVMASKDVQSAIVEAYNHGTSTPATSTALVSPRIVLPDNIYTVVGDELQLFVRGMIEAQNPYNLPYVVNSSVGTSYPRYFDYTPAVGDVGTKTLTVKILNYD